MWTKWTQHLKSEKEKIDFERQINSSKSVLERIKEILDEKERTLQTKERDFWTPGWPYQQAYCVGQRDLIQEIKQLLTLDHRSNSTRVE